MVTEKFSEFWLEWSNFKLAVAKIVTLLLSADFIKRAKFLLHQKISRENSKEVFRAILDLRPHLVVNILNCKPFVTRVTDMDVYGKRFTC